MPRDICTRFGRYLYSTKCSWIIKMVTGELSGIPNKLRGIDLRWTTETGIRSGNYEPVGSKASHLHKNPIRSLFIDRH